MLILTIFLAFNCIKNHVMIYLFSLNILSIFVWIKAEN